MEGKNNEKLWFRAKRYGWGWVPSTWEGWAVTAGYIVLFVIAELLFIRRIASGPSWTAIAVYAVFMIGITAALIRICYRKGEKPGWHWGDK